MNITKILKDGLSFLKFCKIEDPSPRTLKNVENLLFSPLSMIIFASINKNFFFHFSIPKMTRRCTVALTFPRSVQESSTENRSELSRLWTPQSRGPSSMNKSGKVLLVLMSTNVLYRTEKISSKTFSIYIILIDKDVEMEQIGFVLAKKNILNWAKLRNLAVP